MAADAGWVLPRHKRRGPTREPIWKLGPQTVHKAEGWCLFNRFSETRQAVMPCGPNNPAIGRKSSRG